MKKIWIVNYYAAPPKYTGNPRHLEFSSFLHKKGLDVTLFSSGFISDKNVSLTSRGKRFSNIKYGNHKFIHIGVKSYIGNGVSRMISIFQFGWIIFRFCKKFDKPDVILHNIHMPFDYPVLWCAKRLKAKYIAEAWDLWPDSFVRFGLISAKSPITKLAYMIEYKLYKNADEIIFSFEGGLDYLRNRKWLIETGGNINPNKVHYINNGVNNKKFNNDIINKSYSDFDLEDEHVFKIVYLGSIKLVNNLKALIDAASFLKSYSLIKFYIYGDGSDRDNLISYCKDKNIYNVVFKDKWIPFSDVPYVLSKSSLNILNYKKKFGIYGTSSGKLFQYLAAGKPIISNIEMNYCLIRKYKLGISQNLDSPKMYADAILSIYNLKPAEYNSMCARVLEVARKFDFEILSKKLLKVVNK